MNNCFYILLNILNTANRKYCLNTFIFYNAASNVDLKKRRNENVLMPT